MNPAEGKDAARIRLKPQQPLVRGGRGHRKDALRITGQQFFCAQGPNGRITRRRHNRYTLPPTCPLDWSLKWTPERASTPSLIHPDQAPAGERQAMGVGDQAFVRAASHFSNQ